MEILVVTVAIGQLEIIIIAQLSLTRKERKEIFLIETQMHWWWIIIQDRFNNDVVKLPRLWSEFEKFF